MKAARLAEGVLAVGLLAAVGLFATHTIMSHSPAATPTALETADVLEPAISSPSTRPAAPLFGEENVSPRPGVASDSPAVANVPPLPAVSTAAKPPLPSAPKKQAQQRPKSKAKPVPPPLPRMALNYVGIDPVAEQIWLDAINDASLPPTTRQDLIEDLNEDGFPDPRNITMDDLPLIYSRLDIIEQAAPDAMDEVNAAAFAEAYKDLVNMLIRLGQ